MSLPTAIDPAWNQQLESTRLLLDAGRLDEAHAALQQLVEYQIPNSSENLTAAHRARLRLALDIADACVDRSESLLREERMDEGLALYEIAMSLKGEIATLHERLGDAYLQLFELDDAIASYQSAARLATADDPVHRKLDDAIEQQRNPQHVVARCRADVAKSPQSAEANLALANALRANRQLDDAIEVYQNVIELAPGSAVAFNNLAVALKDAGRVDEAFALLNRAAASAPDSIVVQSNLLYTSYFLPEDDPQKILKAHRAWGDRISCRNDAAFSNDRSPDRVLNIGYISPDFREHCQSFFTLPLLSAHDRTRVKVFCYADVHRPDAITDKLIERADVWRPIQGLSDERVAELIRADRIDVLVDLTMHMAKGRAMLFAMKPAPVLVAWLAYPGTTGSPATDYRLSDPHLDPPESDACYIEKTMRLPETFWCYDPLEEERPIASLPALDAEHITFGCLNNFCKVNQPTLAMWRGVLSLVPRSRLILLAPAGEARQRVIQSLQVDPTRVRYIDYLPRADYLKLYEQIDICLDTFPYNGHTTSLDAMWMGVPVVSRCGNVAVSRGGMSLASNLGLSNLLVAHTAEEFVSIAESLSRDLPGLAALRAGLRGRMKSSPLMDAPRLAGAMESCYRQMWSHLTE